MNTNSVDFFRNIQFEKKEAQLVIVAWKLKTPGNVGQVIRLAHNVGAQKVFFVDNGMKKRTSEIKKTAGFSFDQMDWEVVNEEKWIEVIPDGFSIVGVETAEEASNIFITKLPEKAVLLVGSEDKGIPEETLDKCSLKVYIPMLGGCKSLNVSHAVSVAAFEWLRQIYF